MYPRNRKKRTFFSPGTEEKGKRRREEATDDAEPDSEQGAKDPKSTPTKATPQDKSNTPLTSEKNSNPSSPPAAGKTGYSRSLDDDNKNAHTPNKYKQPRKEGDKDKGSDHDDDDDRGVKRKSSKKHSIKQEMDEEGKGSEYDDGDWGSEGEDGNNESGNESGEDSPSNGFHEARESFHQGGDSASNFDEDEGSEDDDDQASSAKRSRTTTTTTDQTGNGIHEHLTPSTPPHDTIMSDESQKSTTQKSITPSNQKITKTSLEKGPENTNNNNSNNNNFPNTFNNNSNKSSSSSLSTSLAPSSSSTDANHSSSFSTSSSSSSSSSSFADAMQDSQSNLSEFSSERSNIMPYKKKDTPIVTSQTAKTNQQNKAKNQQPSYSHPYSLHASKNPHPTFSSEPITTDNFKTLFEEMKVEITRLSYRLEEATTVYNARLLEYEEKYVPRAVYNVMEDEVAYLKQQLQSYSSQQLDIHSTNGLEKVKHDMGFLRSALDDVSTDVRQWRMAMDVDLTDKEDRLTQLSLRLDDIERNQQALIIRYPQLMQPAPSSSSSASAPSSGSSSGTPAHSPTGPERLSSSGDKAPTATSTSGTSGSSGKATSINSIQKDRDKHSQSSHSQRMMLPPDIPKYTPTAAPSSPQQTPASSSAPFLGFESSTPSFIQPEPGGWSQSSVYSRQFAQPSAPAGSYFHSSAPNYKPSSSQSSKSHHHMSIERQAVPPSHDRSQHDSRQHERSHPSHHDRDRLQQERIFQHERLERERLQQERMQDKSSRPVW